MTVGPLYAGIETGGTKILCRVVDGAGVPQLSARFATTTPELALADILSCLADPAVLSRLAAVGMASFGPVRLDPEAADFGTVIATSKAGWSGFDLRGAIERRLAVPVIIDTDVNCAALAELNEGAGIGVPSLAYVTVGTGIGAGLASAVGTLKGALHPEIGHLRLRREPGDDHPSACPYHDDCAEGLAAGPAIRARIGEGRMLEDDPEAFAQTARYLGRLCATLVLAWAPHRIVIGDGVLDVEGLRDAILPEIMREIGDYGPADLLARRDYLIAPELGDAGLAGALRMARAASHLGQPRRYPAPTAEPSVVWSDRIL